jgi:hypothetical protein
LLYNGVLAYTTVIPDGYDPAEARPPSDHGPRADDGATFYTPVGRGVDPRPLPHPQALSPLLAGHLDRNPSQESVTVGRPVGLERPYVRPVKVTLVPHDFFASGEQRGEDVLGEVEERILGDVFFQDLRL